MKKRSVLPLNRTVALLVACSLLTAAAPVETTTRPDRYVLSNEDFGWWKSTSQVLVDWDEKPRMTGLECKSESTREKHLAVTLRHPIESSNYFFTFEFKIPDNNLINRNVQTIIIGGRVYQYKIVQSRITPWFGTFSSSDIILTYGIGRAMVRPNESYSWIPVESLLPQMFEAEEVRLGVAGEFEIDHGNYENRFQEIRVDMDGFKEAMKWCYEQVNPVKAPEFPAALKMALKQ